VILNLANILLDRGSPNHGFGAVHPPDAPKSRGSNDCAVRSRNEEIRRAGGPPGEIERRVIGLKCSQR
jgi:hypothetical protein